MKNLEYEITSTISRDRPLNFEFLTAKELSQIIGFAEYTIKKMARQRLIPSLRLGHRTLRFNLARVLVALERLEIKEYK